MEKTLGIDEIMEALKQETVLQATKPGDEMVDGVDQGAVFVFTLRYAISKRTLEGKGLIEWEGPLIDALVKKAETEGVGEVTREDVRIAFTLMNGMAIGKRMEANARKNEPKRDEQAEKRRLRDELDDRIRRKAQGLRDDA